MQYTQRKDLSPMHILPGAKANLLSVEEAVHSRRQIVGEEAPAGRGSIAFLASHVCRSDRPPWLHQREGATWVYAPHGLVADAVAACSSRRTSQA